MKKFETTIQIRWADLDPNFHVLHSKYYDFGAFCRMCFLVENGITPEYMAQNKIGPILFREEALFKREISFSDELRMDLEVTATSKTGARWAMRHHLFKQDNKLAAIINVEGAWMDTVLRKLAIPDSKIGELFSKISRSEDFKEIPEKNS